MALVFFAWGCVDWRYAGWWGAMLLFIQEPYGLQKVRRSLIDIYNIRNFQWRLTQYDYEERIR